jgi:hypothetical protein
MASRSPTLRASLDPSGQEPEKDTHPLDNSVNNEEKNIGLGPDRAKRRSSLGDAWRRQSLKQESDPFGDADEEGDVKYRTLRWW